MEYTAPQAAPAASTGGGKYMMIETGKIAVGGVFETDIYVGMEWVRSGFIEAIEVYDPGLMPVRMDFGTLVDGEPSFIGGVEGSQIIRFGPLGQCARWAFDNYTESPVNIRIWLFGIESTEATPEVMA